MRQPRRNEDNGRAAGSSLLTPWPLKWRGYSRLASESNATFTVRGTASRAITARVPLRWSSPRCRWVDPEVHLWGFTHALPSRKCLALALGASRAYTLDERHLLRTPSVGGVCADCRAIRECICLYEYVIQQHELAKCQISCSWVALQECCLCARLCRAMYGRQADVLCSIGRNTGKRDVAPCTCA